MGSTMSRNILFAAAGLVLLCEMPLAAQDAVLGQLYGNGVHAYFSQDYVKAHECFTTAIDGHSQDPRVYYFRGLDMLKLGRPHEADEDFKQGAKLKAPSTRPAYTTSPERWNASKATTVPRWRNSASTPVCPC